MKKENIKWLAIQPLTGGMYIGAREAIGHPAEAIVSFPGLCDISYDKKENPTSVGNEHYLKTYLEKHNEMPDYHLFKHNCFDKEAHEEGDIEVSFENIDLVVAVPVCSGLSMATTTANKETRDNRNCNMKYITDYVLTQIKPKAYIFENAPTFMGDQALGLRKDFEKLAEKTGYSILYYKTDTQLHKNCQRRPRTFIIFSKTDNALKFDWENTHIDTKDYFNQMKESEFNNEPVSTTSNNVAMLKYVKEKYGDNWRDTVKGNMFKHLLTSNLIDDYLDTIKDHKDYAKIEKYIRHAEYKLSIGKNYYASDLFIPEDSEIPSVQFRSIPMLLHPTQDRNVTIREFLHLMGMPADFEWYGNESNLPKIGQNVPVNTARFIVEQTIKALSEGLYHDNRFVYQNNINQKTYTIE